MTLLPLLKKFASALSSVVSAVFAPSNPDEAYLAGASDIAEVERRIQELDRRRSMSGFNARFG